jgi:dihydroflavonol-4-reductase
MILLARGRGVIWLPGDVNAIDVRDVARAHITAAERGERGERYILGGHNLSLHDLQDLVADRAGVRRPRWGLSKRTLGSLAKLLSLLPGLKLYSNQLIGLSHWQGYNTEKAEKILGLHARPLEETIEAMITSYRSNGVL